MKRTTALTMCFVALLSLSFISCFEKKEAIGTIWSGYLTACTNHEGYISELVDDMGQRYYVADRDEDCEVYSRDTTFRMVASLALDGNNSAHILQRVFPISYYAPNDTIVPDSLRINNPLEIESAYIGGGYLNINVNVKVKKEGTKHSLIYAKANRSDGALEFKLYHKAYGDEPVYTKKAYISIPLSCYNLSSDTEVFLSTKCYNGDYYRKFIFK